MRVAGTPITAMTIDPAGNVGIGTTAPEQRLHVSSAANQIRIQDSGTSKKFDLNVDGTAFFIDDMTAGANRLTINTGGFVGINDTAPPRRLSITGEDGAYSGQSSGNSRTHLLLENNAGNYIEFLNPSSSSAGIFWSNNTSQNRAGITLDTSDNLQFQTGATANRMVIAANGEIRIAGQTLVDNSLTNYNMTFPNLGGIAMGSAYTYANIYGSGGDLYLKANAYRANLGANPSRIYLVTAGNAGASAPDVVVKAGSVGIGTTAPNRTLSIYNNSLACLQLCNSTTGAAVGDGFQMQLSGSTGYIFNYEAGDIIFGTSAATRLTLKAAGQAIFTGDLTCSDDLYLNAANAWIISGSAGNLLTGGTLRIQSFAKLRVDGGLKIGEIANGNTRYTTSSWCNYLELDAASSGGGGIIWGKQSTSKQSGILSNHGKLEIGYSTATDNSAAWVPALTVNDVGNVGIGTTAPDRLLHLYGGASGQATPVASAQLVLEDDGSNNYISFLNPNTGNAGIMWGDPQDSARAQLIYDHNTGYMKFNPGGAERVFFKSDGNVGIGTNDPGELLQVKGNMTLRGATNLRYKIANDSNNNWAEIGNDGASSQNTLEFFTGSSATASMSILNNGNVGIGTASPAGLLTVRRNDAATGGQLVIEQDSTGDATLRWLLTSTQSWMAGIDNSDGDKFKISSDGTGVETATKLTIQTDGNVGIGVTNPSKLLYVNGTSAFIGTSYFNSYVDVNGYLHLQGSGSRLYMYGVDNWIQHDGGGFDIFGDSTQLMYWKDDGNVGIGTTAPSCKIHAESTGTDKCEILATEAAGAFKAVLGVQNSPGVAQQAYVGSLSNTSFKILTNGVWRVIITNSGATTFTSSVTASSFSGNGASISALNALNISSGTVGTARLGSGTANSSTFLRGDNTWATPSNTTYSAGTGLTLSSTTFSTKLDELTDMTADIVGSQDELILLDNGSDRRKQINEIKLGQFNNDQGWASGTGDITSVGAALGLSGGGTSGAVSLALDLNELVDSNKIAAGDKVAFVDVNASYQSAICEVSDIPLSVFDNDSGWTSNPAVSIASTAADVLSASNGAISADDANTDKLVFWDESAGKLKYLTFSDLTALP